MSQTIDDTIKHGPHRIESAVCEHDPRFRGVLFMPKMTHGCVACGFEQERDENERLRQELFTAEFALRHHGYRKTCDIEVCNCGDRWFHGGNAADRLREISALLRDVMDTNGKVLLDCVKELGERAERAEAALAVARKDALADAAALASRDGYYGLANDIRALAQKEE